jgi:hypothetical protein
VTLLCLPARIAGNQAAGHFGRPRFTNLFGLLARPVRVATLSSPETRITPFVERLWMPAYAVCLHAVSSKGDRRVWTSVEAVCGEFTLFDCIEDLVPIDLDKDWFPPEITETQAVDHARKGLLKYVISQRGQLNKPLADAVEEIRPYHFPLWVYYFRRQGRFLDIKVLDARTGKSAGAKMRVAVLNAMVAARKAALFPTHE